MIDEFGIGLALVAVVLIYLFWRKRKGVEAPGAKMQTQLTPDFTPVK